MHKALPYRLLFCLYLSLIFSAACHSSEGTKSGAPEKHLALHGRVVAVEKADKRVKVAHETIKDESGKKWMDAMTMTFSLRDDQALEKLKAGDQITATLVYDESIGLSWLEKVTITAAAP